MIRFPILFTAVLAAASCTGEPHPQTGGVAVVTTFHALSTIVAPVVGPDGSVRVLLPPGASPHAYEPRPSDLRHVSGAGLVLFAGRGVDDWAAGLAAVPAVAFLDLIPDSFAVPEEAVLDPHAWLDPHAVSSALPFIADALCRAEPSGCTGFRDRARSFAESMEPLVDRVRRVMGERRAGAIVTSGPFLAWWSSRFGPRVLTTVEEREGIEPSAARMAAVIASSRGAAAVVGQVTLPDETARAVAEAASVPYVAVDAIGTPDTAPDYERLILSIAETLGHP